MPASAGLVLNAEELKELVPGNLQVSTLENLPASNQEMPASNTQKVTSLVAPEQAFQHAQNAQEDFPSPQPPLC